MWTTLMIWQRLYRALYSYENKRVTFDDTSSIYASSSGCIGNRNCSTVLSYSQFLTITYRRPRLLGNVFLTSFCILHWQQQLYDSDSRPGSYYSFRLHGTNAVTFFKFYFIGNCGYLSALPLLCFFNRDDTEGTNSSKILCPMFVYVLFYVNLCHDWFCGLWIICGLMTCVQST